MIGFVRWKINPGLQSNIMFLIGHLLDELSLRLTQRTAFLTRQKQISRIFRNILNIKQYTKKRFSKHNQVVVVIARFPNDYIYHRHCKQRDNYYWYVTEGIAGCLFVCVLLLSNAPPFLKRYANSNPRLHAYGLPYFWPEGAQTLLLLYDTYNKQ